ncbi:MAG: outer membrane beta-barrel protein [Acidobacteriota bacterium]
MSPRDIPAAPSSQPTLIEAPGTSSGDASTLDLLRPHTPRVNLLRAFTLGLLALVVSLSPTPAQAQGDSFELTVFGGVRSDGDFTADSVLLDRFSDSFEVDSAEVVGLSADWPLSRNLHLQIFYSRQETELSISEGAFSTLIPVTDIDISYLQGGFLWIGGRGATRPYFGMSAGFARLDPVDSSLGTEDTLAGSIAAGLKIYPTDHIGFRLEARAYWADLDNYEYFDLFYDPLDDDLYQVEATAGVILAF